MIIVTRDQADGELIKMTISAAAQVQRCAEELGLVFFMCVFLPFPLSLLKFILPLSCHCESHTAGFPGVGGGGGSESPRSRVGGLPPQTRGPAGRGRAPAWSRRQTVSMAGAGAEKGYTFDLPGP